jgi:hypothetical protein
MDKVLLHLVSGNGTEDDKTRLIRADSGDNKGIHFRVGKEAQLQWNVGQTQ